MKHFWSRVKNLCNFNHSNAVNMKSNKKLPKRYRNFKVVINDNIPDFSKHPYFIKQHEAARAMIKKTGLPQWFYDEHGVPDFLKED